jgi:acetyltransferase
VLALDARIRVTAAVSQSAALDRMAIRPYPKHLEESMHWQGESLMLRPIKPEDSAEHLRFFHALDPQDVRMRAFTFMRELQATQLARLTQIDYDREMAFIACRTRPDGSSETLAVVRAISDPDNVSAEFAIVVRSDCKGKGLGTLLLRKLIDYCRGRGTQRLVGDSLSENRRLLSMVRELGFEVVASSEPGTASLRLRLA